MLFVKFDAFTEEDKKLISGKYKAAITYQNGEHYVDMLALPLEYHLQLAKNVFTNQGYTGAELENALRTIERAYAIWSRASKRDLN